MAHIPEDGAAGHPLRPESGNADPATMIAVAIAAAGGVVRKPDDAVWDIVALALAAAHAAGVAEGREAVAAYLMARVQAERIMRDDQRRLGEVAMAMLHGDRAQAFLEAARAIREGR